MASDSEKDVDSKKDAKKKTSKKSAPKKSVPKKDTANKDTSKKTTSKKAAPKTSSKQETAGKKSANQDHQDQENSTSGAEHSNDSFSSDFADAFDDNFEYEDHAQAFMEHAYNAFDELTLAMDHATGLLVEKAILFVDKGEKVATKTANKATNFYEQAEKWAKDNPILATAAGTALFTIFGKMISPKR